MIERLADDRQIYGDMQEEIVNRGNTPFPFQFVFFIYWQVLGTEPPTSCSTS